MELIVDFANEKDKRRLFEVLKSRKPKEYKVSIVENREKRSNPQLAYYFGVVLKIIGQETGYPTTDLHEALKLKFNPSTVVFRANGEEMLVPGTTGKMDTKEFSEYIEQIRTWALTELDILIPDPNEVISI